MTPEEYALLKQIFDAVCDLPPRRRAERLDELGIDDPRIRREVERWLEHHDATGEPFPDAPTATGLDEPGGIRVTTDGAAPQETVDRIGPYRILRRIGKGGQGVVYLAEREVSGLRHRFAIKVILDRTGREEILRRFERERRILASLDHPCIGKLHDAGETEDGRPFFVMEFVDGHPIDRWCDEQRLDIEARIQLFCRVCDAVQFAHNAQVVHRDLKPSNILIGRDGVPKLLDFGIARYTNPILSMLEGEVTIDSRHPLTPQYASPEQVRRDAVIGTASDVYSLGVMLYEILSGHRPYRIISRIEEEYRRVILEEEPQRPSLAVSRIEHVVDPEDPTTTTHSITPEDVARSRRRDPTRLRRMLAGDIDNIVLMAMRKEPERRYATAHALAEDLRRHLRGHPVAARPDTLGYRVSSFTRRHRVGVIASAGALVALVATLAVVLVALDRTRRAEALAEARFVQSLELAESVLEELAGELEVLPGGRGLREALARLAIAHLEDLDAQRGAADRAVLLRAAGAWRTLGELAGSPRTESNDDPATALEHYERAGALLARAEATLDPGERDPALVLERAEVLRDVALVQARLASRAEAGPDRLAATSRADAARDEAIALMEDHLLRTASDPSATFLLMALLNDRYRSHRDATDSTRADALLESLLADPGQAGRFRRDKLIELDKAMSRAAQTSTAAAASLARERLALARELRREQPSSLRTLRDLCQALLFAGRYQGAVAPLDEALPAARALWIVGENASRDGVTLIQLLMDRARLSFDEDPAGALADSVEALRLGPVEGAAGERRGLPEYVRLSGLACIEAGIVDPVLDGPPLLDDAIDLPAAPVAALALRLALADRLAQDGRAVMAMRQLDAALAALDGAAWSATPAIDRARGRADVVLLRARLNPGDGVVGELARRALEALRDEADPASDDDRARIESLEALDAAS